MNFSAVFLELEKSVAALGALSREALTRDMARNAVFEHGLLVVRLINNAEFDFAGSMIDDLSKSHGNYGLELILDPALTEIARHGAKEIARRGGAKEARKAIEVVATLLRDSFTARTPEMTQFNLQVVQTVTRFKLRSLLAKVAT